MLQPPFRAKRRALARAAPADLVGWMLDRRGALHRGQCSSARFRTSIGTTCAFATDIDTDVIAKGVRGEYPSNSIDEVPNTYRDFFRTGSDEKSGTIVMGEELRSLITFRRLNLMETWPFNGLFDAIFCRNVMIYFDTPTKTALVDRFTQQLKPDGWLYIGHSESLIGSHPKLELVGRTIYRRDQ